jgi:hypothetical protein
MEKVIRTTNDNMKCLSSSRLPCALVGNAGGQYDAHLALSLLLTTQKTGSSFGVMYQPDSVRSNKDPSRNGRYSIS